jgi:carbamoyl-phosphate synthase large subunit
MEIVRDDAQLERYIREAVQVSGTSPVLLDSYLAGATEVDVDALCDGTRVHVAGIMQHIEEAGVHSGDSACCLPPHTLRPRPSPRSASRPRRWPSRSTSWAS